MRTKLNGLLTLLLALVVHISFAQQKTVSGTVTDQGGLPLPGVNIVVQGTTTGTQTDFDGNYSIAASQGQTLLVTYIGQKAVSKLVGAGNTINIQMQEDAQALEEVIVTAQGIKREKKSLGYAVSSVGEEDLEQRAEGDVGRVLNGKASGVLINASSGVSGSATNIIIRGFTSISGSNQPLFIVDGVPFASDTNNQGDAIDGNVGSSRFLDLDPNNIANVNVLKGLAAANLYGTAGRNGVILITTKAGSTGSGKRKSEITVSSSLFFNQISTLPDYQNQYGGGFDQAYGAFFSNWGPDFNIDSPNSFGSVYAGTTSDGTLLINHPYSVNAGVSAAFPEFQGASYEFKPYQGVQDFFRTGTVTNNSVNASGSSEDGKISYNASVGNLRDEGFTPGNKLQRTTISVGGKAELSNRFTVNGTMNFTKSDVKSPPIAASLGNGSTGDGSSIFGHLFFTPRSIDLMGLPFQSPTDGRSVYYRGGNDIQNPRWTAANAFANQVTNRVFGSTQFTYKISDNINAFWRTGLDFYTERNEIGQNKGGAEGYIQGRYETFDNKNTIWDHTVQINGMWQLSEKLDMNVNLGATSRRTEFSRQGVTSDQQSIFNVFKHYNFATQAPIQFDQVQNIMGVYAQAEFGYDNFAYLTLAARNDWVSNFIENSITYPSASLSILPTALIDGLQSQNGLNFLKLRAGYGTSAGFFGGYPVANTATLDTREFLKDGTLVSSITVDDELANPGLSPELLREIEFGLETRLFGNRVSLDLSVYKKTTTDLISEQPLDPSSGYTTTVTNIGEVQVRGIEADLGVTLFRNDNPGGFNWNLNSNFTADESTVIDLGQDTDNINIGGLFSDLSNFAVPNRPFGVILGSRVLRDDNGNRVVASTGSFVEENGLFEIGDPNADWRLNVSNGFSFKNFSFNFDISYRHGGDVYSNTISALVGRGLTTDTQDRVSTFILPGVKADGSVNDIQINNSDYYFSNVAFGPSELQVYDGSTLRLRELRLGYSVPSKSLEQTPFGSLSFTLSGQNLWFKGLNTPDGINFDPENLGVGVGNALGFDFINSPGSVRYGMSVKATF
ncbi:SusC/RagA family TonB-linked outer membrane protein [Maribacter sp. ACAM166]|uniref:SusC/RagA family TonB-linked outer membrane protein n=1 Tax=Maribacter sp. ACAM166 TaxID=2508996 RepID=UPI0010FEA780|nr:SusC/RagA family TonB-linked outer membrane protein [Maribacter sp. ACAM166]TLP82174.1 SusC/RagA family TonB-linked outer membrane protein [Maribacter sp. ACAM166]